MASRNDGIIKIGFQTDVQEFVKEIKKELSSVKDWGIADSVKDEIDEVLGMVDNLGKSFADGMSSKLDTKAFAGFEKKISAEVQAVTKRVDVLENTLTELINTTESVDKSKFTSVIQGWKDGFSQLDNATHSAIDGVKQIRQLVESSNGKVQFVDTKDLDALDKERSIIKDMVNFYSKFKSSSLNKNETFAYAQIKTASEKFAEAQAALDEYNKSKETDKVKLAELRAEYVKTGSVLLGFVQEAENSERKWSKGNNPFVNVKELNAQLNEASKYVTKFVDDADAQLSKLSRAKANALGQSSEVSMDKENTTIKVPMDVDVIKEEFWPKIQKIINYTQKQVDKMPIQVDFLLTSKYSSKKTNKVLKEFQEQIGKIDDSELKSQFEDLYATVSKDLERHMKLSVTSEIKDEGEKVQRVINEIKTKLNRNKIKIFPTVDLKDIDVEKLQKKLDRISKSLKLTLSNVQLANLDNNFIEKFEAMNNDILSPIAKSLEEIVGLTRILNETVGRTEAPIIEITNAVKELASVLQSAFGIVSTVDLDAMFSQMEKSVANINGSLRGGNKNPLVNQLKEILAFYREYQKLGGTKALSDLGGADNVQKWLEKHQNDELGEVGNTLGLVVSKGIQQSVQVVTKSSQELVESVGEAAIEAAPATNKILDELGESFGDKLSDAIVNSKDKVKAAIEQLYKEGVITPTDLANDRGITAAISDEIYNAIVEHEKDIVSDFKYDSSYNDKYRLKAHIPTSEEKEAQKERWAEALSEVGQDSKWARLDFDDIKNTDNLKTMQSYYKQLTDLFARLNKEISSDRGSKDLREFVGKLSNTISALEENMKAAEIANRKYISKKKNNYDGYIKASDVGSDSLLSSKSWNGIKGVRNKENRATVNQIIEMLSQYKETSDAEILNTIKELVNESNLTKNMKSNLKADMDRELSKVAEAQEADIKKAAQESVDEYAEGMEEAKGEAKKAGADVAEAAAEGTAEAQDSNSPSKVAEKLGEYFGEGYANGILNTRAKIKNAIRALIEENVLNFEDLAFDEIEADASKIVLGELANNKAETKTTTAFRKKIQKINAEVKNLEKESKPIIKSLRQELEDLELGGDINFKKILNTDIPESLIGYYRGLETYLSKAKEIINQGEGSDSFLRYIEKVEATLDSVKDKLSTQGWRIQGNTWVNDFENVVIETSRVNDNLSNVLNVLDDSTKKTDDFADAIQRANNDSLGYLEKLRISEKSKNALLKNAIKNKTTSGLDKTIEDLVEAKQELENPMPLTNVFEMANAIKNAEDSTLDFLSVMKARNGVISNAFKNIDYGLTNPELNETPKVTNVLVNNTNKIADAIERAENGSLGYLENLKISEKASKALLSNAIKNKTYKGGTFTPSVYGAPLASSSAATPTISPDKLWNDFIDGANKAYKNVKLVEEEVNKIAEVNFGNLIDAFPVGRLKNQTTNDAGEIASYTKTFEDVIDVITKYRTVERDGVKEREPFDTTVFNYAKVEKKILDYDSEIAKLSYQIKNATEQEAAPLLENKKILEDERDLYLEILKYAVEDEYEMYDKSSYSSFEGRRSQLSTLQNNKLYSSQISKENKELEKQELLSKKLVTQESELNKLRAKTEAKGISTEGIDNLYKSLYQVTSEQGLREWLEDLKQFKNYLDTLVPETDEWAERLKKIDAQQIRTWKQDFKDSLSELVTSPSGIDWKKLNGGSGEWTGALAQDVIEINSRFDLLIQKYKELTAAEEEVTKQGKLFEQNPEVYVETLQRAKDAVSAIKGEINQLKTKELLDSLTDAQTEAFDKVIAGLEEVKQKQEAIIGTNAEKMAQFEQKVNAAIDKANEKSIKAAQSGLLDLGGKNFQKDFVPEIKNEIESLTAEFERLLNLGKSGQIIPKEEIEAATLRLRELKNEVVDVNNYFAESKNVTSLYTKIANFMSNNTAMSKEFKGELKDIMAVLNSGLPIMQSELARLESRFNTISGRVRELGQTGNSLFTAFTKQLKSANAQFLTTYFSLQDWIRYIRQAISIVQELDYALIDLRKTTTMNAEEINEFYFDANQTARDLGVTTKQIIEQAAAWSRLGYSSKEAATEMAALSSKFKQISPGMDLDNATDGLVSTMKAFHIEVADAEREIMDVINKTGNTMATTNDEIVEMLKRSSAAMSAANNSLKETTALEAAAVQITRNAETTGTAFRTISMRIRGYDEETEDYIGGIEELSGKIANLTKSAKTPGGITLFTDETKTEYKSTYQILKDISEIYHDLTDKNQAELLETLAGKRGGQVLAGILDDFSEVERALKNMEESAGSADAEMGIIEESLDYKINNLKETWTGIVQELIDRGYLGQIIDFLTNVSEIIGNIVTEIGPLPTILSGLGLGAIFTNLDKIQSIKTLIESLAKTSEVIANSSGGIEETVEQTFTYVDLIEEVSDKVVDVGEAIETAGEVGAGGITKLNVALNLLKAHPIILAIGAIAAAAYAAYKVWDYYTISVKEATEAMDDFSSEYNKATSDLNNKKKTVEDLSDSYYKLAKGVDSLTGKNISLSSEDYDEFVATNQKLANLFPQLIKGVDAYGNYILDLGDNADEARAKLEALIEQEQISYNYDLYNNIPTVSENAMVLVDDALEKVESVEQTFDEVNEKAATMQNILKGENISMTANVGDEESLKALEAYKQNITEFITSIRLVEPELASALEDLMTVEYDENGNETISIRLEELSEENQKALKKYASTFKNQYEVLITKAQAEITKGQQELRSAWLTLQKYIVGGINFLSDDNETTEALTSFVNSLPAEFAESLKDVDVQEELSKWVAQFESMTDEQKIQFTKLLDPSLTPQEKVQLYNELRSSLPESFDIPIHFVADEAQGLIDRVKASKSRLSKKTDQFGVESVNPNTIKEIDTFFENMQIDTEEEYELWLKCADASDTAIEAMRRYGEEVRKVKNESEDVEATIIDSVDGVNKRLKSQFDELGSLYQNIFYNDKGFTLSEIDNDQLESLKKAFIDLEDEDGNQVGRTFKGGEEAVNKFIDVLTSAETKSLSLAEQQKVVQNAFNELATAYFYSAEGLNELNDKTKDTLVQQFKMMGITNADEVIEAGLKLRKEIAAIQEDINKLNFDNLAKGASEALEDEKEKLADPDWISEGVAIPKDIQEKVLSGTLQSKFGNIDMDKRTVIRYNDEILNEFKDAMSSWGTEFDEVTGEAVRSYYDEISEAVKNGENPFDTVWGQSSAFEMNDKEIEVAFSPIMVDENGNNPQFLSEGTVTNYIQAVLDKADKEIKASGEEYSQEAVIKRAFEIDLEGMNVEKYDAQGRKVGEEFVHGLIAQIGDSDSLTAEVVGSILHFAGEEGAYQIAEDALEVYTDLKERAAEGTLELTDLTAKEISVLKNEGIISAATAKSIAQLALQEQLASTTTITTSESVQALADLATQAGIDIAELTILQRVMQLMAQKDAAVAHGASQDADAIQAEVDRIKADALAELREALGNIQVGLDFSKAKTDAGKGGSDAGDAYVEAYEKELQQLEDMRDQNLITEKEYLERLKALIDKYFKDRAEYAEKYAQELQKYMDQMLTHYNSVISGVTTLLDHRINQISKQKETVIDALNEEKEAAEEAYQAQIDAIQEEIDALDDLIDKKNEAIDKLNDQIDAINEANEARDRSINLQKAEYELQRQMNQRTKLVIIYARGYSNIA